MQNQQKESVSNIHIRTTHISISSIYDLYTRKSWIIYLFFNFRRFVSLAQRPWLTFCFSFQSGYCIYDHVYIFEIAWCLRTECVLFDTSTNAQIPIWWHYRIEIYKMDTIQHEDIFLSSIYAKKWRNKKWTRKSTARDFFHQKSDIFCVHFRFKFHSSWLANQYSTVRLAGTTFGFYHFSFSFRIDFPYSLKSCFTSFAVSELLPFFSFSQYDFRYANALVHLCFFFGVDMGQVQKMMQQ